MPARTEPGLRTMATDEQKKANRRLGLVLATIALVFFAGFVARMVLIGH